MKDLYRHLEGARAPTLINPILEALQPDKDPVLVVPGGKVRLRTVADGFVTPTAIANNGSEVFLCDQVGTISVLGRDGYALDMRDDFKKLPPKDEKSKNGLDPSYDERGLLGLTFHPSNSSRAFLYISEPTERKDMNHDSVLVEFSYDGNRLIRKKDILRIPQEAFTHNAGCLRFGPDQYLYIAVGDGGCCGDEHGEIGNAQDLSNLKGKILRIDVDQKEKGIEYSIPSDNPFTRLRHIRREIWAYGFRNPWQFSFDKSDLWVGDVGEGENMGMSGQQSGYERIYKVQRGGNHGWRIMEGTHYFDRKLGDVLNIKEEDIVKPFHEYDRKIGRSVIGGYVYRGVSMPPLRGKYIFADWSQSWGDNAGQIYFLDDGKRVAMRPRGRKSPGYFFLCFGEGPDRELYVGAKLGKELKPNQGLVFRLEPAV